MLQQQLKRLRIGCKMSQKELASKLFVSQQAVGKWERGEATPNPETIARLAEIFDVTADELIGRPPQKQQGVRIPVLGDVAAGIPIEAVTDIVDYEEIDDAMASTGEHFGLRIKGTSMEPRMMEGDVVIVRKQETAETGDTVVVLVNGDSATVKKIKFTPAGIYLIPTNPSHEVQFYSPQDVEQLPVRVIGKVVELRAKY